MIPPTSGTPCFYSDFQLELHVHVLYRCTSGHKPHINARTSNFDSVVQCARVCLVVVERALRTRRCAHAPRMGDAMRCYLHKNGDAFTMQVRLYDRMVFNLPKRNDVHFTMLLMAHEQCFVQDKIRLHHGRRDFDKRTDALGVRMVGSVLGLVHGMGSRVRRSCSTLLAWEQYSFCCVM